MNWAGISFYVFIGVVGAAFGMMGCWLIDKGPLGGTRDSPPSKLSKTSGVIFALFGMGMVITAVCKCGPLLTDQSRASASPKELTEAQLPVVLGELVLEKWEPLVFFRPNSPLRIQESAAKETEPMAFDANVHAPASWEAERQLVPVKVVIPNSSLLH